MSVKECRYTVGLLKADTHYPCSRASFLTPVFTARDKKTPVFTGRVHDIRPVNTDSIDHDAFRKYTVSQKESQGATKLMAITSSNLNCFSKSFYHWKESEISNKNPCIIPHHTLGMLPHYLGNFKFVANLEENSNKKCHINQ